MADHPANVIALIDPSSLIGRGVDDGYVNAFGGEMSCNG
jgi:hypothetical protein